MKKTAKGKSGGGSGSANYSNVSNVAAAAASETLISQNVKNQPAPPSKTNGQTTGGFNEKNARRRQEVEQKQAEVKQGFATFLSQKSDTKQQKNKHNSNTSTAKKQSTVVTAVKDQDGQIEDTSVVKVSGFESLTFIVQENVRYWVVFIFSIFLSASSF